MIKRTLLMLVLMSILTAGLPAQAARYVIDTQKHHAFITFKIKHLGYSWLLGRFDSFSGDFSYDEKHPENNKVAVSIAVDSIDTNHAKRDKHLRSDDFFDVARFPTARFVSTSYEDLGSGHGLLKGQLSLHGVTREIAINIRQIGTGPDPWGGYRRGFEGTTTLHLSDYHFAKAAMLGPVAEDVELYLSIEGIRQ